MKRSLLAAMVVLAVCALGIGIYRYAQTPKGDTVESREELLRGLPGGGQWNIATERDVGNYVISGVYSGSQAGIAVFRRDGGANCKLVSMECRGANDVIISQHVIQDQWYDFIWFNGAAAYAEVTYSVDGAGNDPVVFDVTGGNIICSKSPADHYNLKAAYYDGNGLVRE